MAEKFPSSTNQDLQLCPSDQQDPGSCTSCYNLHMCRDYLLTSRCSRFESDGKCTHSHSLFTIHNQRILKKLNLSAKDEDTFDRVSRRVQRSKPIVVKRSTTIDPDDEVEPVIREPSSTHVGRGRGQFPQHLSEPSQLRKTFSDNPTLLNTKHLSITMRVPPLTNSDHPGSSLSKSMDLSLSPRHLTSNLSMDINNGRLDRHRDDRSSLNARHSSRLVDPGDDDDRSSLPDDESAASTFQNGKSRPSSQARGVFSKLKGKFTSKSDRSDTSRGDSQLKYIFARYSRDDELSYLHGPVRYQLLERKRYQIFPSGYYRLADTNQEKEIQDKLNVMLPIELAVTPIVLPNDDFALFISSSAAERILEHNQITYGIISHPYSASFSIEIKRPAKDDRVRSSSVPSRRMVATRLSTDQETPRLSTPNGKFCISQTNSSIDVIQDDITNVQVDMMVCVTTSVTLLDNVLRKAGRSTESEFKRRSFSTNPILLDGGDTKARKILFIPWKLKVERGDSTRYQQSLSKFVKQCIDEADRSHLKSIAFPSIGMGELGLDPNLVSESMINAANECLQKCRMDVVFVIYPSSGIGANQQSYQAFRDYLDNLCRQNKSTRAEAPSVSRTPRGVTIQIDRSQRIDRTRECKRISIVSDSADSDFDHRQVIDLLKRLIVEKRFDLSLVDRPFLERIELLIDLCLDYHVLPHIDFTKGDLILRGDQDSCAQCFMSLRNQRSIHDYSITKTIDKKNEEITLSVYVCMKIDEALANEESDIRVEDAADTVYRINLHNSMIQINDDVRTFKLYRTQLNAKSKISLPTSWSPSVMIRTTDVSHSSSDMTKCLRLFERTMSKDEWHIERVDTIENWPLYVHHTLDKSKDETFAFHACSYSSVQSIIHYGLHSNYGRSSEKTIHLTEDALSSHIRNARRSIDGKYYMFVVRLSKKVLNHENISLSNEDSYLALPTHLFVYRREVVV